MSILKALKPIIANTLNSLYNTSFQDADLTINLTKPEFVGDYTLVTFGFIKIVRRSPEQAGNEIGERLLADHTDFFSGYNVIKGFLNLSIKETYWTNFLESSDTNASIGMQEAKNETVVVEYSSPNTNKPLHLGHLRNNFLGWSVAEILKTAGYNVKKTAILNDRGIHICKSMAAWQLFANGATPDSTGIKGDHFVGDYYVMGEKTIKEQAAALFENFLDNDFSGIDDESKMNVEQNVNAYHNLINEGKPDEAIKKKETLQELARKYAPFMKTASQMLLNWENGEEATIALWQKMNSWVYEGFNETYKKIGSDFDKNYFESETYLLGKEFVAEGLAKGVFYKKEDGSVWIDLTDDGLDEKLVLRKDGTSVYITQDLGLADKKFEEFQYDQSIYVIADEQNYHMKVLKLILKKLGKSYADGIYHLSYGLVELPNGRMKTREGTVVDADDILEELKVVARNKTQELGKVKDFNPSELNELYDLLAIAALKFFILRVDPRKRMVFNPEESIDFHGFTGPFVAYTYTRIKSILRKNDLLENNGPGDEKGINTSPDKEAPVNGDVTSTSLFAKEKKLIVLLEQFESTIEQAVNEHNPSLLAIYAFDVAKTFNTFYTDHSVMNAESEEKKKLRLQICSLTSIVIAGSMHLLGIKLPERM